MRSFKGWHIFVVGRLTLTFSHTWPVTYRTPDPLGQIHKPLLGIFSGNTVMSEPFFNRKADCSVLVWNNWYHRVLRQWVDIWPIRCSCSVFGYVNNGAHCSVPAALVSVQWFLISWFCPDQCKPPPTRFSVGGGDSPWGQSSEHIDWCNITTFVSGVRLGQREALRGLDDQWRGMLPTLRSPEAQPTSKWLQCLGHVALATDATHHPLFPHLAGPNQPYACWWWVFSGEKPLFFQASWMNHSTRGGIKRA